MDTIFLLTLKAEANKGDLLIPYHLYSPKKKDFVVCVAFVILLNMGRSKNQMFLYANEIGKNSINCNFLGVNV